MTRFLNALHDMPYTAWFLNALHALVVQVHFNDATEVVLSSETRSVTYVSKTLQRSMYPLSNLPNDSELLQRLKYTKEILMKLIAHKNK
jgi:hypothetical protein